MTLFLLMVWISGAGAPLIFDAYPSREQCQAVAMVHNAKPGRMAVCPTIRVVAGSNTDEQ